jgi:hypothetical protein
MTFWEAADLLYVPFRMSEQQLRDAEDKANVSPDEREEEEADTDGFYSCNCGERCRC